MVAGVLVAKNSWHLPLYASILVALVTNRDIKGDVLE
jgi:hypothetical protein